MKYIKTPITARKGFAYSHIEADGKTIALMPVLDRFTPDGRHYDANERLVQELVQAINAYDALVAALRRAEQTFRNLAKGWLDGDGQAIALNEAANLRAAIALAERETE